MDRRLGRASVVAGLFVFVIPSVALAGPPALPAEGETPPPEPAAAPADPAPPAPDPAGPPAEGAPADPNAGTPDAGGELGAEGSIDGGVSGDADFGASDPETEGLGSADAEGEGAGEGEGEGEGADSDDPGMVRGKREGLMPTNRGGAGLFHTTLPDAGGRLTFRFRLHTDFFRKEGFIYEGTAGPDEHARVRGGVAMGFSPAKWGELFFSVYSAANRNTRVQEGRQDAEAIFALGDIDFGFKGAHRFKNGIGVGGQLGLGLLSGSNRLLTQSVNFWVDGLFAVDIRYLTKRQFPFRFTTNIGWMLDNSLRVADYAAITDSVSREVTRFALSGNHNRVRMRYAIDFPIRVGKERQFGIDPILEWSWDISTTEEPAFAREGTIPSALPRSSQWLTIGLRANVISGLHIDAAADVGMVSPSFEWGPPMPPWQVILGLGWSFDPTPVVKEVPVETEAPPPAPEPVIEGRILGQVVDPDGNPVPDAKILFPGLATGAILTDASGNFTSYRFPAGSVAMQVVINNEVAIEQSADVADGQDTQVTITLTSGPTPPTGILRGNFVDESGTAVPNVSMHVTGQGVDEPFSGTPDGQIALELFAGDYRATLRASGYKEKTITFTVPADGEFTINETLTKDAPPDTPRVIPGKRSIKLKGRIRYDGNKVAASSHGILDELATFLKYHPEYAKVQIGVHTDDRGAAKKRSDDRAASVVSYLVSKGVSPGQLSSKGYGASKPVAVNLTAKGRAKNNRTVITVLQKN